MGAGPEHGVLSHALALSANGVDVGEVDEVVEDEEGRDSGARKKEREGHRKREKENGGEQGGPVERETKRRKSGGKETGDKERRVDDEGRRR